MGLLDSLTNLSPEQTQGLLAAASQIMQQSGDPRRPFGLGQAAGLGIETMQASTEQARQRKLLEDQMRMQNELHTAQASRFAEQATRERNKSAGISALSDKVAKDPAYKPTLADMLPIDEKAAFKMLSPDTAEFGLDPKIGTNPKTGETEYFTQDRQGNPKWLDIKAPANSRFIPGNDYKADQIFNPRTGTVQAAQGGGQMPTLPGQATTLQGPVTAPPAGNRVPLPGAAPWDILQSPKAVDQMKEKAYEQDNKRLDEMREGVRKGRTVMQGLDNFGKLNRQTGTGGVLDRMPLPTLNGDKQQMEAVIASLLPYQRPPGSGSTSDFDQRLYLQALPSLANEGNTNKSIRDTYAQNLKMNEAELLYKEKYFQKNGHLQGADEAWKPIRDWLSASPEEGKSASKPKAPGAPKVMKGQVMDGFRYKGGDPADQNSWEPAQ